MYIQPENERNMIDIRNQIPYINKVFYELHPTDENMYRTHTPTYNPYAIQGRQIVWQTTNYVTGIPDKNIMQPFNPKLKSATQRFTQF